MTSGRYLTPFYYSELGWLCSNSLMQEGNAKPDHLTPTEAMRKQSLFVQVCDTKNRTKHKPESRVHYTVCLTVLTLWM
jgi:hypothetical protein